MPFQSGTQRGYTANRISNNVSVIDALTNTVQQTIPVGPGPADIRVHPQNESVWVANGDGSELSVLSGGPPTTAVVGLNPMGLAFRPAGDAAYVAVTGENVVKVVGTNPPFPVLATIPVGNAPFGVATSLLGQRVAVTNGASNTVSLIDTSNNTVIATLPVGNAPDGVIFGPPPPPGPGIIVVPQGRR